MRGHLSHLRDAGNAWGEKDTENMERTTFEKQLAAGKLSGVYLLDGNEEYLKQRALHRMIDTVCENAWRNSTAQSWRIPPPMI